MWFTCPYSTWMFLAKSCHIFTNTYQCLHLRDLHLLRLPLSPKCSFLIIYSYTTSSSSSPPSDELCHLPSTSSSCLLMRRHALIFHISPKQIRLLNPQAAHATLKGFVTTPAPLFEATFRSVTSHSTSTLSNQLICQSTDWPLMPQGASGINIFVSCQVVGSPKDCSRLTDQVYYFIFLCF